MELEQVGSYMEISSHFNATQVLTWLVILRCCAGLMAHGMEQNLGAIVCVFFYLRRFNDVFLCRGGSNSLTAIILSSTWLIIFEVSQQWFFGLKRTKLPLHLYSCFLTIISYFVLKYCFSLEHNLIKLCPSKVNSHF